MAINWVMRRDAGARASYQEYLDQGHDRVSSAIYAQRHNKTAQIAIRECEKSNDYIGATKPKMSHTNGIRLIGVYTPRP